MLSVAEIASEIQSYLFFRAFPQDLILQLAGMLTCRLVKKGDVFLKEGQSNHCLFFLRSGRVSISLQGEVIGNSQVVGDVFGDMSVISNNPTATTLFASEDCEFFVLDTHQFQVVDSQKSEKLNALIYRVYSVILIDRLMKMNEKARLFEILHRELHEAQSQLRRSGGRALFLESNQKQQLMARMAVGGTGIELDIAGDENQASEFLQSKEYDLLFCEDRYIRFLKHAWADGKAKNYVLLTTKDMQSNLEALKDLPFVDHVVSFETQDRSAMVKTILITLTKVLTRDFFGVEKYLSWGAAIESKQVANSKDRLKLRTDMEEHFAAMGVRRSFLDRMSTVSEELLMNAVYDAPVDGFGKPLHNYTSRKEEIQLESHQESTFRYGSDGNILAISVTDPFGSLSKDTIHHYLLSNYRGDLEHNEAAKKGAGRGLHQIIENSDLTIFNVRKGQRTEVICLFYLDRSTREGRPSLHYFFCN